MNTIAVPLETCPHCGGSLAQGGQPPAKRSLSRELRYDLVELAARAHHENAYDEGVKVRVTQDDIKKLLDKRKKARR